MGEQQVQQPYMEPIIPIGEYLRILRSSWGKIIVPSLVVGTITLIWMMRIPPHYRAMATIAPTYDDGKQSAAMGALTSFGISTGGPSKLEDLETLLKSNDLAVRVFKKYDVWSIVLPDRYDSKTGKIKPGWVDRLFGHPVEGRSPAEWDAIRAAQLRLSVGTNRRSGTISLSFESQSPEGSANIVNHYLEEAKSRLQEEALDRAGKNKKFIQDQIAKNVDVLTRDRLFQLFGQEVEREMLARNRDQFGFRVIDSPRAPDRSSRRGRLTTTVFATSVVFFSLCGIFVVRGRKGKGST